MKNLVFVALLSLCLFQTSLAALTCNDGYYDPGAGTKCKQCPYEYTKCQSGSYNVNSGITGYTTVSGVPAPYCPASSYYNSKSNTCDPYCAAGCYTCSVDNTFCLTCQSGYVWDNYKCLPAVVGLEAASLALLVIALVFSIIGCCYVNKARK